MNGIPCKFCNEPNATQVTIKGAYCLNCYIGITNASLNSPEK